MVCPMICCGARVLRCLRAANGQAYRCVCQVFLVSGSVAPDCAGLHELCGTVSVSLCSRHTLLAYVQTAPSVHPYQSQLILIVGDARFGYTGAVVSPSARRHCLLLATGRSASPVAKHMLMLMSGFWELRRPTASLYIHASTHARSLRPRS